MKPPAVWMILADWWQVSPPQARRWWQALGASPHPQVRSIRQSVLYFAARARGSRWQVRQMMFETCRPAVMISLMEVLVTEGRLTRREASAIEERLLQATDRDGAWYGKTPMHA